MYIHIVSAINYDPKLILVRSNQKGLLMISCVNELLINIWYIGIIPLPDGPNILLNTLLSWPFSLHSSINVTRQVSHLYRTDKIIF
jgi:hypothetical protein